jgi:hypothetical protein
MLGRELSKQFPTLIRFTGLDCKCSIQDHSKADADGLHRPDSQRVYRRQKILDSFEAFLI